MKQYVSQYQRFKWCRETRAMSLVGGWRLMTTSFWRVTFLTHV